MKRFLTILVAALAIFMTNAAGYTIDDIPNVHIADSTRFVTNPDGVLTPAGEAQLNEMLRTLMRETSAEVFVVAVAAVDENADVNDFATELFRTWGIGKKDNNNGLLILLDMGRKVAIYRTGNGLEGLLPDGLLGTLHRRKVVPKFREGDFDGGLVAAVSDISQILSSPEGREEVMSELENNASNDENGSLFTFFISISLVILTVCLLWLLFVISENRTKPVTEKYAALTKMIIPMGIFSSFTLGIALPALIIVYVMRKRMRYGKHLCASCGAQSHLVDEVHDNEYLTHQQDIEERIGSVDYDVWLCPQCCETEIIPYRQQAGAFSECPVCKAHTYHVVSDRTVVRPTSYSDGTRLITSRCVHCGFEGAERRLVPKLPPVIILPGGGGGGSFGGGGGFGGGSMGGGTTSGGGFSGGW